jgi:small multidrug resistance pump
MGVGMNHWLAIVAEVTATTALKASNEFTRLWPSLIVVVGYGIAFYFMTISLRVLPVGIMYAIWSGLGIVLISILGWVVYRQALDLPAMIGMGFIITGVIIINVFSKSVAH